MKKILALFVGVITLASCGKDKSNQDQAAPDAPADKYALEIEAIYEKDDSLVAIYQDQGFYQYEKSVSVKIKGMPSLQKISVDFPAGQAIENVKFTASNNKDQEYLTIKNISVTNNGKVVVDGDNGKHSQYFAADEAFSWDAKNSRFVLDHTKKYQPSFVGNETLLSLLVK